VLYRLGWGATSHAVLLIDSVAPPDHHVFRMIDNNRRCISCMSGNNHLPMLPDAVSFCLSPLPQLAYYNENVQKNPFYVPV
jgi:hypothetical protein